MFVLSGADRTRLRALQDRWLEKNRHLIEPMPKDTPLFAGGPTLQHVAMFVFPEWERWFEDQLA